MRSTISFKRFCLNGFNMDNLFNVTLLPASYSVAGTDDSWYLIGSVPPSSADIESLMFGADVVSKHLLNADIPWVIVRLSDNDVNKFVRIYNNVYLIPRTHFTVLSPESELFLINKSLYKRIISPDLDEVVFNLNRLSESFVFIRNRTFLISDNNMLSYGISV